MPPPTYALRRIQRGRPRGGITAPATCVLEGVLKFDGEEAPHCVYNEHVALNLGRVLQVPVADGVLASTGDGPAYASLLLDSPGVPLPNLSKYRLAEAAVRYPEQVAALVVFDIFIGNWDRGENMKAALVSPHVNLFQVFDHSHALLGAAGTEAESIEALGSDRIIVQRHPFYRTADQRHLEEWVRRVAALPDYCIAGCCNMGKTFRAVTSEVQTLLARALMIRRDRIGSIVASAPLENAGR